MKALKEHGETLAVVTGMLLMVGALLFAQANRKPHTCTDKCCPKIKHK